MVFLHSDVQYRSAAVALGLDLMLESLVGQVHHLDDHLHKKHEIQ